MGKAAILIMWPEQFEQIFVAPSHEGSIWNFTLIGQAISEEMFKECGQWRQMDYGVCLSYKLTYELKGSGELKNTMLIILQNITGVIQDVPILGFFLW